MKNKELPWYISHYFENISTPPHDEESAMFRKDFLPLYKEYVGTKNLLKHIRNYINTHEITRKDDFRFQLVCMWCDHIHYYRDLHNIPFKAEDVFKIRIPKEILNIK